MRPKLAKLRIGGDCWMHLEPERVSAVNAPDRISVKSDVITCEDAGQSGGIRTMESAINDR